MKNKNSIALSEKISKICFKPSSMKTTGSYALALTGQVISYGSPELSEKTLHRLVGCLHRYVMDRRACEFAHIHYGIYNNPGSGFDSYLLGECLDDYGVNNSDYACLKMAIQDALGRADKPSGKDAVDQAILEVDASCNEWIKMLNKGVCRPAHYEWLCFNDCARTLGLPEEFHISDPRNQTKEDSVTDELQQQEVVDEVEALTVADDTDIDSMADNTCGEKKNTAQLIMLTCKLFGKEPKHIRNKSKFTQTLANAWGLNAASAKTTLHRMVSDMTSQRYSELESDAVNLVNDFKECF